MKNKAILVIDMIKDTFALGEKSPLVAKGLAILPALNRLLYKGRKLGMQVIFATDSFLENDYLFSGGIKPYDLRGTEGAEVIDEIEKDPRDLYLPKRRFSAFFKTDLDQTLRVLNIDTAALTGLTLPICVLATALDALSHDFKTIIIEDCCATANNHIQQAILDGYRKSALYPFFKIMRSDEFLKED